MLQQHHTSICVILPCDKAVVLTNFQSKNRLVVKKKGLQLMYFCKEESTCLNITDVLSALLFSDYFNLKGTIVYAELFIKIFTDI